MFGCALLPVSRKYEGDAMKQISLVAALLTLVLCYPVAAAQQPAANAPRSAAASPIAASQVPVQTAAPENPAAVLAQPPLQITHHGSSPIPARRLYRALKTQFAGGQLGPWQVISSDPKTRTLVVRRNYIARTGPARHVHLDDRGL